MTRPAEPGPLVPSRYRVVANRPETSETVTLELEPVDRPLADPAPGQFNMLWAFGVGEIPISVSGAPNGPDGALLHTVRSVGAVSAALCKMAPGDVIGVRGPYGTGWDVQGALHRDVVVVAGGVGFAPLRSAVLHLARRRSAGQLTVLVGARSPAEILFAGELEAWRHGWGVDVQVTVDRATPGWRGEVGVVTRLIERTGMEPARTTAFVCGPEIMMRFAARALIERGVPPAGVQVSLERNMECAIGHCGHCQLSPLFVCADGPVFSWERVAPLLATKEL